MENDQKVLAGNTHLFDSKPVIVKPWTPDVNYTKDPIKSLPLWIKLRGLDVKFWGEKSLAKIPCVICNVIKVDQATLHRDK